MSVRFDNCNLISPLYNNQPTPDGCCNINGYHVPNEYVDPISADIMWEPVLLVPSGQTIDKTTYERLKNEQGMAKDPTTNELISIAVPNRNLEAVIKKFVNGYPALKQLIEEERALNQQQENKYKFYPNVLMQTFVNTDHFNVPGNQECTLITIPNLCWRTMVAETRDLQARAISQIINRSIFPLGKILKNITYKGADDGRNAVFATRYYGGQGFVKIQSPGGIDLETHRSHLYITVSDFFDRMISSQIEILVLAPNQVLFFEDISNQDLMYINNNVKNFYTFLLFNKPNNCKSVKFLGEGFKIETQNQGTVALYSPQGMSIKCEKIENFSPSLLDVMVPHL